MTTDQIWIFRKEIMKKIFITLIFLLFTSNVNAGSCPMLAGKIQKKIDEVSKLHNDGIKAHKNGEHAKSEEMLKKALNLFKG